MRRAASAGGPPLESKVTKAIMAHLKKRGIWCFKVAGGPMQQRGVPDIICSVNGAFVALEVKRPELGRLTDLQALTIERIREAGGVAEVVTSVEEAASVIDGLATVAGDVCGNIECAYHGSGPCPAARLCGGYQEARL